MDNFLRRIRRGRAGWPGTGRQEVFNKHPIVSRPRISGAFCCVLLQVSSSYHSKGPGLPGPLVCDRFCSRTFRMLFQKSRNQPFTAPEVRPLTNCFCMQRYMMIIGREAIRIPASMVT